jgi:hypothetical protein
MITSGLFHGLMVLPVLLSFIGSEPYAANKNDTANNEMIGGEELNEKLMVDKTKSSLNQPTGDIL